jgi:site-specific recombinase XerD
MNITYNAKLNREKFIQKKKNYNNLQVNKMQNRIQSNRSYHNYITRRKFTNDNVEIHYYKQPKKNPYKNFGLLLLALGIYMIDGKFSIE